MNVFAVTYSQQTRTAVGLAEDPLRLVLWDCHGETPKLDRELTLRDARVPRLLPALDGVAFVCAAGIRWTQRMPEVDALRNRLEVRSFEDLDLLSVIELDHDQGHVSGRNLTALGSDPDGRRIVVSEEEKVMHLIDPNAGTHQQFRRDFGDTCEAVALDPSLRFLLYGGIEQDVHYRAFRFEVEAADRREWLGTYDAGYRDHHDHVVFSRFEDAFVVAGTYCSPFLHYVRFDPATWAGKDALVPLGLRKVGDDALPLESTWSCEPTDTGWTRRFRGDLPAADLAIVAKDLVVYGGFRSVVTVDPQHETIRKRHDLDHRVRAITVDEERGRILAATRGGLVELPL